jgi:hypothetical protein
MSPPHLSRHRQEKDMSSARKAPVSGLTRGSKKPDLEAQLRHHRDMVFRGNILDTISIRRKAEG